MPYAETRHDLDDVPSLEEVLGAMGRLHAGTTAGQSGVVPEMIMSGGCALHARIHALVKDVWQHGSAVTDWHDAEIVPIPKKGDLRCRDNWRASACWMLLGSRLRG